MINFIGGGSIFLKAKIMLEQVLSNAENNQSQ